MMKEIERLRTVRRLRSELEAVARLVIRELSEEVSDFTPAEAKMMLILQELTKAKKR